MMRLEHDPDASTHKPTHTGQQWRFLAIHTGRMRVNRCRIWASVLWNAVSH